MSTVHPQVRDGHRSRGLPRVGLFRAFVQRVLRTHDICMPHRFALVLKGILADDGSNKTMLREAP
jgi:hypothetical protein